MQLFEVFVALSIALTAINGYPQNHQSQSSSSNPALIAGAKDVSALYPDSPKAASAPEASQQAFYPSLQSPPLGHSRPFLYSQPEAAYSQRAPGYSAQQVAYDAPRYAGYKDAPYRPEADLLGSGNFGVLRGGTFYDKEEGYERDYGDFFGNGHGRPFYGGRANPRPAKGEQFANFRDFADINAPASAAYSQYAVVYANGGGQRTEGRPKNIIERLAMLDVEEGKKGSKAKAKLAKVKLGKKQRAKKQARVKEMEPLLALS